jgi:signal transduction histidine kinase/CheY-like chemotaxis protein
VLCFFSREPRPYDQALAESMIDFGIQIDQFVKRKRTEAALIAERTLLAQRVARRTSELSMANADLARAIRTRDEFLATMSHELRTPLNAVIGFTEALQEQIYGPLNEKQLETLRVVGTSSHHLLDLINDILDLSRIEASSLDLRFDLVNIEALCHASLRLIKPEAVRKQIQVTAHIECSEKTIQADERRLKQILVNLLSNAVKFTPPGGAIGLEVTTCETENQVCFCVWDTGIGIAPEDLGRLFKPFEQLDGGLNKRHEGTGMGLALVSRLTDMHNGSVSVQSQTGQGSRFTVSLPCQRPDSDQDAGQSGGALPVLQCVLIIAEAATAAAVTPLFQQWNAHVHVHTCGAGALDRVLEVQPDIILLAPALSDISGWQVALRFKVEPRARDIPLIMLAEPGEHVPGLPLGLAASLVKPVSQQELAQVIEIVLQRKPHIHSAMLALSTAVPEAPLILLAEDNEIAISMVVDYLQQQGYRVDVARNGAEALEHAREELPALILMDIQMPGMDGLQAIRHIRDDARLSHLPIIALTALAMPGDRETCLQAGANEYLSKPVNLKHLVTVIESQLASARETRA